MILEARHIDYLANDLGLTVEEFLRICEDEDSAAYDELLDTLAHKEGDIFLAHTDVPLSDYDRCPGDLIDFMCGPYDDN